MFDLKHVKLKDEEAEMISQNKKWCLGWSLKCKQNGVCCSYNLASKYRNGCHEIKYNDCESTATTVTSGNFQALGYIFALSVPKNIVLLHSLLQGTQKIKYPKVAFSVVLKKASTWSDLIKLQLLEECYEYGSRLHPSWPAFYFKPFRPPTTWFLAISTDTW